MREAIYSFCLILKSIIVQAPESPLLGGEMWFQSYHVISSATSITSLGNIESFLSPHLLVVDERNHSTIPALAPRNGRLNTTTVLNAVDTVNNLNLYPSPHHTIYHESAQINHNLLIADILLILLPRCNIQPSPSRLSYCASHA